MSTRKGFTLIELLVVIAIIAILAAILFPVFAQAREKARAISCLSNQKQLALSFMQYEQDYDEKTPNGVNPWGGAQGWGGQIYTYVKSAGLYTCPDDAVTPTHNGNIPFHVSSYAYNSQVSIACSTPPNCSPDSVTLSSYNAPASTVLLCEVQNSTGYDITKGFAGPTATTAAGDDTPGDNGGTAAGYGMGGPFDPGGFNGPGNNMVGQPWTCKYATGALVNSWPAAAGDFVTARHTGGANYVMADGHAKFLRPAQVSGGQLNSTAGNSDCGNINQYPPVAAQTGCSKVAATFNLL